MITKKEDLYKTYVINDGEIRSLYVGLCNKFGIECESNSNASGAVDITNADYIEVYAGICFYTNTPSVETSKQLTLEDLKPQTKEVEWVNGDECRCNDNIDYTYIGLNPHKPLFSYIVGNGQIIQRLTSILSKPETPEQKLEREELEAAYDLYCEFTNENSVDGTCMSSFSFKQSLVKIKWLAIVRKTNYKVKGE